MDSGTSADSYPDVAGIICLAAGFYHLPKELVKVALNNLQMLSPQMQWNILCCALYL